MYCTKPSTLASCPRNCKSPETHCKANLAAKFRTTVSRPGSSEIYHAAEILNIQFDSKQGISKLHTNALKHELDQWADSPAGSNALKGLKAAPGPSQYLLYDLRHVSPLRARLRFGRSSLNASLAERKIMPDPNCRMYGARNHGALS